MFWSIPPAFSHLKPPHGFGTMLLGAYQMAGGIFLLKGKKVTTIMPNTSLLDNASVVTATSTDLDS